MKNLLTIFSSEIYGVYNGNSVHRANTSEWAAGKFLTIANTLFLTYFVISFYSENYTSSKLISLLLCTNAAINLLGFFSIRNMLRLPLTLFSVSMLFLVGLPLFEIDSSSRHNLLTRIGFIGALDSVAIIKAAAIIGTSYTSYIIGVISFSKITTQTFSEKFSKYRADDNSSRMTWKILSVIGLLGYSSAIISGFGINNRASPGFGVIVFLLHAWMIAPAIAVIFKFWGKKSFMLISLVQLVLLVQIGGARSSLTLFALSIFFRIGELLEDKSKRIKFVSISLVTAYAGLVFIQSLPILRAEVRSQSFSSTTYVEILKNPLSRLTEVSGFDTAPGAILAVSAKDDGYRISIFDPLKAITSFVPRQVWPDKPRFVGPDLTQRYSLIGGNAGIIISGAAYLYLMGGGIALVAVAFLMLGFLTKQALQKSRNIVLLLFLMHFMLRFFYGGDAFDLFFILQDILIFFFVKRFAIFVVTKE